MFLDDYSLHDSTITNIEYDGSILSLYIEDGETEDRYILTLKIDEYDLQFYFCERYPVSHQVHFRGMEIDMQKLKSLFQEGYSLVIIECLRASDCNLVLFECATFPYPKESGVSHKIFIKLSDSAEMTLKKQDMVGG